MHYSRIAVLLVIAFLFTVLSNPAQCEVTARPFGFALSVVEDEETEVELTLANDGEDDVAFSIDYQWIVEEDELRIGPRRDDPGDFLADYEMQYGNTMGLAWDEPNGWMWGLSMGNNRLYAFDPEEEEVMIDVATADNIAGLFYLDGVLHAGGYDRHANTIYRFDVEGNVLNAWQSPVGLGSSYIASDCEFLYTHQTGGGPVLVFDLENLDEVASIDCQEAVDNAAIYAIELVPVHNNGPLWLVGVGHLYQCFVDEDWNCELVQDFDSFAGDQPNREDGFCGIGHDGENLWRGTLRGGNHWYVVDDGVQEFHMLVADPETGIIPGNDSETITILVQPEGYEAGVYNVLVEISLTEPEEMRDNPDEVMIQISAVVSVDSPTANVAGTVIDAAFEEETVEGVIIDMDRYIIRRFSDEDGAYSFNDLPFGAYEFSFTADDYLPATRALMIDEEGEVELDIALLHSECNPSVEVIIRELQPNEQTVVAFDISNDGNGPLTYTAERKLLGDANAEPWVLRNSLYVGEEVDDSYIMGAVFDGDNFYVSGSHDNSPVIYVLDRDGNLQDSFDQPGDDRRGLRDLAWDGNLIWGADSDNIYGFNRAGEVQYTLDAPFSPTSNVTWDPIHQWLWVSTTTTNIIALDLNGDQQAVVDRQGLRVYGLGFYPDDPDGYNLYIFAKEPDTDRPYIHKANTDEDDVMFVEYLDTEIGGSPSGIFITNQYDIYSYVMVAAMNAPSNIGGDRIDVWQVDARKSWMQLEPMDGVIEAEQHQQFELTLDATGLPPAEFEGEIVFLHDGIGGETILPITLDVIEEGGNVERAINFERGWNMISLNVVPPEELWEREEGPDVVLMLEQLRIDEENHHILLFKDEQGQFYSPDYDDFNNIPYWNLTEGYQAKVDEDVDAIWLGIPIPADADVPLDVGWNMIAYFPTYQLDASNPDFYVLSPIIDNVLLAKDNKGNFMLPQFEFSNMEPWCETQGYQVKIEADAPIILNYPPEQEEDADLAVAEHLGGINDHWVAPLSTGENMSVLALAGTSFAGCELGVFNPDGLLVGSGVFDISGKCGLAVWGDDQSTEPVEGLREGEAFELRLYDAARDETVKLHVGSILEGGDLLYQADKFVVVTASVAPLSPEEFYLSESYPNPFNNTTRLSFGLPETGKVSVSVYDLNGRLVTRLVDSELTAGHHYVIWNAGTASAGVYLVRMEAVGFDAVRKVTLLK